MYRQIFFATVAIAFVFGNVAVQTNNHEERNIEECNKICTSEECLSHVNMLLNSIQPDIDPCQDFYSFVCSGYKQRFGKDETKTVYDETWYSLQIQLKDMLDHLTPAVGSVSEKMKTMYDTCMNDGLSELRSVSEALKILNSVGINNWPNLDPNVESEDTSLSEIIGKLAVYREFSFITFKLSPFQDTEKRNSKDLPIALVFPDNFLLDSELKPKDVESTVRKVLAFFNIDEYTSNILWKEFSEIEDIGIRLQSDKGGGFHRCMDGSRGRIMTVNCSEKVQDSLVFLCNIWKTSLSSGNFGNYFLKDSIHLSCRWDYANYVKNIFPNLTRQTKRSVINYLAIRFFVAHLDDLNLYLQRVRTAHLRVRGSKQRTSTSLSRWEYCVAWLIKYMNLPLGYEYTQKHFKKSYQIDVSHMIRNYVKELKNQIDKQHWLTDNYKTYLKNQMDAVNIGFRNTMRNYRDESLVARSYKKFKPVKGSFLKSILELQKTSLTLSEKDKAYFNGFYSSSNSYTMDFGFTLFLPPTYSYSLSKLWNYATLGWVIGHELSHNLKFSFDIVGRDNQTESNLNERINCYVQQYSEFLIEKIGKRLQSEEAQEEIFADNVGWSLTEKILERYLSVSNDNLSLPGYRYTPRQLMYIKFAQACCEVLSRDVEYELYSSNPQSVENLRVLAVLQNSKMFSEAFNCSSDAKMNPVHKCTFFK